MSEYASLEVEYLNKTLDAVLVNTDDLSGPVWLPFWALHFDCRKAIATASRNDTITIRVDVKQAERKGLI